MLYLLTTPQMPAEAELPNLMAKLPEWRRQQALRFKHYLGQRNCTLSYLLLALSISLKGESDQPAGIRLIEPFELFEPLEPFAYSEHGKPYLPSHPNIHFNLSHCRNAVACIVDKVPVGIDVEDLGRYSESVARYAMNESEMHQIQSNTQSSLSLLEGEGMRERVFTSLWTQKEAVLKLHGTGITDNMKDVLLPENIKDIEITTEEHLKEGFVLSFAKHK